MAQPDNTRTIAHNTFWYSVEMLFGFLGALIAPILVARVMGPARLGYFSYMVVLTNFTAGVGAYGLPVTTRKYMAEYLNRGQAGLARSIYWLNFRLQMGIAAVLTTAALALVFAAGDPSQRAISVLLVLSIAPRMMGFVPSQANNAAESMRRNTGPSLVGGLVTVSLTLVSLWVGWDLPGVAASMIAGPAVEAVLKIMSVRTWLRAEPEPIPDALRRQMWIYSGHGIALMLLNVVVWDRSDVLFLKWLNHDPAQITFFSTAFNLTERLLQIPTAFASSVGVTMMAQYGRGQEKVKAMTVEGARYAFLIAVPLLVGAACVGGPAVVLIYGERFRPMVPVLSLVALLAIPKALSNAPTQLLQTTANQGFLVACGCCFGAVDIGLDILLTPKYGAIGAAIANGTAQTLAAVAVWIYVYRRFELNLRLGSFARIAIAAIGLAAAAVAVRQVVVAVAAGAAAWFVLLRVTRALDGADRQRLINIGRSAPARLQPLWNSCVDLVAP